jgi:hypothetical protein
VSVAVGERDQNVEDGRGEGQQRIWLQVFHGISIIVKYTTIKYSLQR